MRHPFELNLYKLKEIDFKIEEIYDETAEKVAGGSDYVSQSLREQGGPTTTGCGEAGGGIISPRPSSIF